MTDEPGPFGWPLCVDPDLAPGVIWITDGDGIPVAIGIVPDEADDP